MRKVEIKWLDSSDVGGWESIDDNWKDRDLSIYSVGYLIYESDDRVAIAQGFNDEQYLAQLCTPGVPF